MNELILLRADLKQRYSAAVHSRKSLQQLEVVIASLQRALESQALKLIRPENNYWAALSNAMAGAVEETRAILEDAMFITQLNPFIRFCSYFCLGMGLDADVKELNIIFIQIRKAVAVSGNLDDLQQKRNLLRKVNSMGFTVSQQRLKSCLSKIQEESSCLPSNETVTLTPQSLIKSGA